MSICWGQDFCYEQTREPEDLINDHKDKRKSNEIIAALYKAWQYKLCDSLSISSKAGKDCGRDEEFHNYLWR